MKIFKKILVIAMVIGLTILSTRIYSSFLKKKAAEMNACYSAGKIYKEGEHFFKSCNGCICGRPKPGIVDLSIGCTEVACPENLIMDSIKDILFVK